MTIRATGQKSARRRLAVAACGWTGMLLACSLCAAAAAAVDKLATSTQASLQARDRCQTLMHEDSLAFARCVDALLRGVSAGTLRDRSSRLGISYYGWLAATAAAKNGLPTAENTALHFLHEFRPIQRQLRISDDELCATIPGDCVARIARLKQMEHEAPMPER